MNIDRISSTNVIALIGLLISAVLVLRGHAAEGSAMATGCFGLLQHRVFPAPPNT